MQQLIIDIQTGEKRFVEVPDEELPVLPQIETPKTNEERISDLETLVLQLGGII
jgi:hypothetical protein